MLNYRSLLITKAVNAFKKSLLSSEVAEHVAKIIQFGSTVKGKAAKVSDIDLLIISTDGQKVHEKVAEIAFLIQMDFGIGLEPIVEDLDDIIFVHSYFIYNVMQHAKEVYTMDKERLKQEAQHHLTLLAEEYLDSAEDALKAKHFRLAIDAGYNAAELAVKAMLLAKKDDLPGSHGAIIGHFGKLYVKAGQLDKAVGRKLNQALELRNSARYKYQASINQSEAESVIAVAGIIIEHAKKILKHF